MELPQRKPNRLPNFDYSTPGAYFITICAKDHKCIFGHIVGGGDSSFCVNIQTFLPQRCRNAAFSALLP